MKNTPSGYSTHTSELFVGLIILKLKDIVKYKSYLFASKVLIECRFMIKYGPHNKIICKFVNRITILISLF